MRSLKHLAASALSYGLVVNILVGFADMGAYGDGFENDAKVVNGHYFLNQHGHPVEVSAAHFRFARVHDATIIPSFLALAMIAALVEQRRRRQRG